MSPARQEQFCGQCDDVWSSWKHTSRALDHSDQFKRRIQTPIGWPCDQTYDKIVNSNKSLSSAPVGFIPKHTEWNWVCAVSSTSQDDSSAAGITAQWKQNKTKKNEVKGVVFYLLRELYFRGQSAVKKESKENKCIKLLVHTLLQKQILCLTFLVFGKRTSTRQKHHLAVPDWCCHQSGRGTWGISAAPSTSSQNGRELTLKNCVWHVYARKAEDEEGMGSLISGDFTDRLARNKHSYFYPEELAVWILLGSGLVLDVS